MQTTLRCVFMRAGTSRGPFFLSDWLPADPQERDRVLLGAIGAADASEIDGLGGGTTLTSKVAIVSRSSHPDCDVDYLFAQLSPGQRAVDTRPNCGNMLAGVGPFAIEQGLVAAGNGVTTVRVHNVNTDARIDVTVQTPGGKVTYDGDARTDGVSAPAAPVHLTFLDVSGGADGRMFPTGQRIDRIDGLEVTCIDAAMPMVLMRADSVGVTGRESAAELDANAALLARIEQIRRRAGVLMGLGDVAETVVPKPVLLAAHEDPGAVHSRYFTPKRCHTSHAVTGAIGVATALALPGTVACRAPLCAGAHVLSIHHPTGVIQVAVELDAEAGDVRVARASVIRTVRKIMQGELHIPATLAT